MSDIEPNPLTSSALTPPFIEASFVAHEETGDPKISRRVVREISASLGIDAKKAAGCAYLAQIFVGRTLEEINNKF